ncbi:MAG: WYL domain-containing protein [Hamadaea sp.]|nr:WYL domain-containing protein [Hamadaea sp.]
MRADRLLSLVLLLQARGRLSASQLAKELGVSPRTIYRDVVTLSSAGIPIYADAAGYQLVDGYRTQLTGLTADEARGLVLTGLPGAAADLGLAEVAAAAQLKLTAALPEAVRDRADRMRQRFHLDTPGWYHDGDRSEHLVAVADAVWRQREITVDYESWTGRVERRLLPYGLVLKAGKWYLVAATPRGVQTYRVNQIRSVQVLEEGFAWPEGFDLASHWAAEVAGFRARLHQGEAVVRLSPEAMENVHHFLGAVAAEAAHAGAVQPDGWVVARLPIESEAHAEREFLRFRAGLEVLEPASLRARIGATARALATLYPS